MRRRPVDEEAPGAVERRRCLAGYSFWRSDSQRPTRETFQTSVCLPAQIRLADDTSVLFARAVLVSHRFAERGH